VFTLSDHGGAGTRLKAQLNGCATCCAPAWRARRREVLLGGVLYMNEWYSRNRRRHRATQNARTTPQSRLDQGSCGIEICYALQLHAHDYAKALLCPIYSLAF
jgi:hypothetical protein